MAKIEVNLPQRSMERISRLMEITEAGSEAEVLRNALRLYEAAVDETLAGGTVVVIRLDGTQLPVFDDYKVES